MASLQWITPVFARKLDFLFAKGPFFEKESCCALASRVFWRKITFLLWTLLRADWWSVFIFARLQTNTFRPSGKHEISICRSWRNGYPQSASTNSFHSRIQDLYANGLVEIVDWSRGHFDPMKSWTYQFASCVEHISFPLFMQIYLSTESRQRKLNFHFRFRLNSCIKMNLGRVWAPCKQVRSVSAKAKGSRAQLGLSGVRKGRVVWKEEGHPKQRHAHGHIWPVKTAASVLTLTRPDAVISWYSMPWGLTRKCSFSWLILAWNKKDKRVRLAPEFYRISWVFLLKCAPQPFSSAHVDQWHSQNFPSWRQAGLLFSTLSRVRSALSNHLTFAHFFFFFRSEGHAKTELAVGS